MKSQSFKRAGQISALAFAGVGLTVAALISMTTPKTVAAPGGDDGPIGYPPEPIPCGQPIPSDLDIPFENDRLAEEFVANCPDSGIIRNKSLFITEPCVIDDPCRARWNPWVTNCAPSEQGAWTFGTLMAAMLGHPSIDTAPQELSFFVEEWLNTFLTTQNINGFSIPPRPDLQQIIDRWWQLSEEQGLDHLDMRLAPFRLAAIVNRIDLRMVTGGYANGNAGEGRFVFYFLDNTNELSPVQPPPSGEEVQFDPQDPNTWRPLLATAIFEYFLPAPNGCPEVKEWGQRWFELGNIPFGEQYRDALQDVTDDFAGVGAMPSGVNGSALAQLRTNEVNFIINSFTPMLGVENPPWELREFVLQTNPYGFFPSAILDPEPVDQTVDIRYQDLFQPDNFNAAVLEQFVDQNQLDIVKNVFNVPETFNGNNFQAGTAINPSPNTPGVSEFFWRVEDFDCGQTRFNFAIAGCNGCHARDAGIDDFLQVKTKFHRVEADLSGWLTGDPPANPNENNMWVGSFRGVNDPSCPTPILRDLSSFPFPVIDPDRPNDRGQKRAFKILQRRALDLCDVLSTPCGPMQIADVFIVNGDEPEGDGTQSNGVDIVGTDEIAVEQIFVTPNISKRVH